MRTTTYAHVEDGDEIRCQRKEDITDEPYYVLDVGRTALFLRPAHVAAILGALSEVSGAAARDAKPRRPVFHSLSACHGCGCSGDDFASPHVETFELTGELYCEDCADGAIEQWTADHSEEAA